MWITTARRLLQGCHPAEPSDDSTSFAPTILVKRARAGTVLFGSTPETDGKGSLELASLSWTSGGTIGRTRWDGMAGTSGSSPGQNAPLAPGNALLRETVQGIGWPAHQREPPGSGRELARIPRRRACPLAVGRWTVEFVA